MNKVLNITHIADIDGLASQAIVQRYCNKNNYKLKKYWVDYPTYESVLEKALEDNKTYKASLFIITDMSVDDKGSELILNFLEQISKLSKLIYIDHHKIMGKANKIRDLSELIHDDTEKKCAAQLVQEKFMPDDEISRNLAELAYFADFSIKKPEVSKLGKVIRACENSNKKINVLVNKFSKGIINDEYINKIYGKRIKIEEKELPLVEKRMKMYKVGDYTLGFTYSKIFSGSEMTRELINKVSVDLLMGVPDKNPSHVIFRRKNPKINVFEIVHSLGGGGHEDRGGILYNKEPVIQDEISKELISLILEEVKNYLNKT